MISHLPVLHFARVTIEAVSPLSIASGLRDGVFDTVLVRDAQGLPAIPGTSLAGLLRSEYRRARLPEEDEVFGHVRGDEGSASRINVTWGHIHDAGDKPVDGIDFDGVLGGDPILEPLMDADPPHRDHVRIGHRGVGEDMRKFDRSYVPAGHRFTFDLSLWDSAQEVQELLWGQLLGLLATPGFRLGGATRRGFGQLKVMRVAKARFNFSEEADRARYAELPARLDSHPDWLKAYQPAFDAPADWIEIKLELKPDDFWRFGGDQPYRQQGKPADAMIYSESRVHWNTNGGHSSGELRTRQVVVPASGVKGALVHRSAFHYNRLAGAGNWAEDVLKPGPNGATVDYDARKDPNGVRELFGHIAEDRKPEEDGSAGCVLIDDVLIPDLDENRETGVIQHNSIDRFTGGVRDKVLFAEEAVYGRGFGLTIRVPRAATASRINRQAFRMALEDLAQGRLALGAASAKGHGYFETADRSLGLNDAAREWFEQGE